MIYDILLCIVECRLMCMDDQVSSPTLAIHNINQRGIGSTSQREHHESKGKDILAG
jgi:hypothetical protein